MNHAQKIFLLTGSNEGQRETRLQEACNLLTVLLGKPLQVSSVYETAAWGKTDQPAFLNQVLVFATTMDAHSLLKHILAIEQQMGRHRSEKWAQRVIDIDILFYGDMCLDEDELVLPHPFLHQRRFTLVPLCEIAADFVHPRLHKTMQQLLDECTDTLEVKKC